MERTCAAEAEETMDIDWHSDKSTSDSETSTSGSEDSSSDSEKSSSSQPLKTLVRGATKAHASKHAAALSRATARHVATSAKASDMASDALTLDRTESQAHKQSQVEEVVGRLVDHHEAMKRLKDSVSRSVDSISREETCLEDTLKVLEESRKIARNFGEDLLEDTLALDKLTALFSEDRAKRKKAIATLDALLEEVDAVKSHLAQIEKDSRARLEEKQKAVHQMHQKEAWILLDGPTESIAEAMEAFESFDIDMANSGKEPSLEEAASSSQAAAAAMELDSESEAALDSPRSFDRTESQVHKQTRVHDVLARLEGYSEPLQRLKDKVSRLVSRIARDGSCLEDEQKVLQDCQKIARNLGEDALEDMVALDNLSKLFPEDQASKKQAIASLDALLEEVDAVKSQLLAVQKDLNSKLQPIAALAAKKALDMAANDAEQPVLRLRGSLGPNSGQQSATDESATDEQPQDCASQKHSPEVPVPQQKFWEQLELPAQFDTSEEVGCYTLSCQAPGLQAQDVAVEVSPDSTRLLISGMHLPSEAELEKMQERIVDYCWQRGHSSLDSRTAQQLYASRVHGSFGSFSKTFQLPRDVDVSRIETSCTQGILRVKLPKQIYRARRPVQSPSQGGHPFFW